MFERTEMQKLVDVIVNREMANGLPESEARIFALGYIVLFVQRNLIDVTPKARRQVMQANILERISIITGDL
jgi:hypothetical protein